jgi:hypothetical protein
VLVNDIARVDCEREDGGRYTRNEVEGEGR